MTMTKHFFKSGMEKKSKNVPNLIENANEPVINDDLCLREKNRLCEWGVYLLFWKISINYFTKVEQKLIFLGMGDNFNEFLRGYSNLT